MSLFELIPSAYAQTAGQPTPGVADTLQSFAPFIIIIGIFYFLMFRPQQQKAKQLKDLLSKLRRGDSVVTAGGIIGTVARVVSDTEVTLEVAEGVRVRVVRSTIASVLSKTEAPPTSDKGEADDDKEEATPASKSTRRRKTAAAPTAADGTPAG